jgi:hypothetical protein
LARRATRGKARRQPLNFSRRVGRERPASEDFAPPIAWLLARENLLLGDEGAHCRHSDAGRTLERAQSIHFATSGCIAAREPDQADARVET